VTSSIDSGSSIDVVFLDFAKAFDKIPRQRLLSKLKSHGISGKVFKWIEKNEVMYIQGCIYGFNPPPPPEIVTEKN